MKKMIFLLFLVTQLPAFAQTEAMVGDYALTLGNEGNNLFEYDLTLRSDGTFDFHYHSIIKQGIPPEKHKYGKGTWKEENQVITFFTDKQKDMDEKYTLDFTNTKARFITKSPRDKSDLVVNTKLKFLGSDIPWLKTLNMLKK